MTPGFNSDVRSKQTYIRGEAFTTFIVLQIFLLEEDMAADRLEHQEAVWVDVLLTIMIGFFGIGVFSNQKFPTRTKYD